MRSTQLKKPELDPAKVDFRKQTSGTEYQKVKLKAPETLLLNGISNVNRRLGDIIQRHQIESAATNHALRTQNAVLEQENAKFLEMTEGLKQRLSKEQNDQKMDAIDRQNLFDDLVTELLRTARPMISEQIKKFYDEIRSLQEDVRKSEVELKEVQLQCESREKGITNGFIDSMPEFHLTLDDIHRSELNSYSTEVWAKQKNLEEKIVQIERSVASKALDLEEEMIKLAGAEKDRKDKTLDIETEEARLAEKRRLLAAKRKKDAFDQKRRKLLESIENERKLLNDVTNQIELTKAADLDIKTQMRLKQEAKSLKLESDIQATTDNCKELERANFNLRLELEKLERENTDLQQIHIRKINEAYKAKVEEESKSQTELESAFSFAEKQAPLESQRINESKINELVDEIQKIKTRLKFSLGEPNEDPALRDLKLKLNEQIDLLAELRLKSNS